MYSIDDNDKKDFEELKLKIYDEVKSFIESHPNVESYIKRYKFCMFHLTLKKRVLKIKLIDKIKMI